MFSTTSASSRQSKIAVGIAVVFLFFALFPLLVIAHFNYPGSDDFAYAGAIYMGMKNGNSFLQIVKGCWDIAMQFYFSWQGRYFDNIVSAFGIGTAVPGYYFLGTYLTLVLFVSANIGFIRAITYRVSRWDSVNSWILAVLFTAMQVLYLPYPSEGFFWYVGATGYTMAHALLLFLGWALLSFYVTGNDFKEHGDSNRKTDSALDLRGGEKRRILPGISAVLLAAMIGGSNYSTGLLTAELLTVAGIAMLLQKKKCVFLWAIWAEYLICFIKFNALSPGNHARMGNVESLGIAGSIFASLKQGAVFLKEWFRLPVFLFLIVILLLCASQVAKMNFLFRLPGAVTVISFGLYCSIMTPPFFAGATWGPGRLINLVYFGYYFFLAGNLLYWTGWAAHKSGRLRLLFQREMNALPILLGFFMLLLACLKIYGLQSTSSSSALLSLAKGEAAVYLQENELRWEIYTDDSARDAEVEDFSVKPYVLYHDDIVEDETDWRNYTVASFFGKNSVRLKK